MNLEKTALTKRQWFRWPQIQKEFLRRFIYCDKTLPGNLRQYEPRFLRKEVFPQLPVSKNAPSLCIVTPSFNQGSYIRETVESVLQDGLPLLDYLVMDGGSQDESCQILKDLNKENVFRWQSAPDRGQADAINQGFQQVEGEIMAWINSDDVFMPGALRFVTAFFAANPEVDVVYSHRLLINSQGQEIGRWVMPAYYPGCLKYFDHVPQETLFWRRRIWDKVGSCLNDKYCFALDWELLQRFERAGAKFVRLPYFLACFRAHDAQKTHLEIDGIGKQEMQSLCPKIVDPKVMKKALEKEFFRARLSGCLLSCRIRSTWF